MRTKKAQRHISCTVVRTALVRHGTINMATGATTAGDECWETGPCGAPLFNAEEQKAGVCRSCARGWTHPNNYPAGQPRPERASDE